MLRNDYRRSLILLRPHDQGYSGHVRLERRTLIGSLYMVINAPNDGGSLCASLVRRDAQGTYFAVRLGELRRDSRGQATLAYSFDPRNIDGRTLEEYLLIAIVRVGRENCDVVLSGNVNGSQEVDWSSVRGAACDVCACVGGPAGDICPPRPQPIPPAGNRPASPGEGPAGLPTPTLPGDQPASPGEGPVLTPTPALPGDQPASPGEGPVLTPTPALPGDRPASPDEGPVLTPTPAIPEDYYIPENDGFFGGSAAVMAALPDAPLAGDILGIDMASPWPGVSEQLRSLFLERRSVELMLGDGHVYIEADMPDGTGYDSVFIGVKAQEGAPVSVAYALPARYTPEPPPGLEDYVWMGGAAEGWWVLYANPATGEPLS